MGRILRAMKPVLTSALAGGGALSVVLALAACHPPHLHRHGGLWAGPAMSVPARLNCPDNVGALTRTAAASDGQSCAYKGADGEDVSLTRLVLNGQSPQAGLASIEASLRPLLPPRQSPTPTAGPGDGRTANVDLPGVHVHAQGDQAEVNVFGVTIKADGQNANVNVGHGSDNTVVLADPNGAEIRSVDIGPANARLAFILASENPGPSGLHAVGYLARGPLAGPIVVATFKAPAQRNDWRGDADLNDLLRMNAKL